MGTRSVIALPHDGGFQGRYAHWDGYPTGVGSALVEIVRRDGLDIAKRTLTSDHYGWSSVTAEAAPELSGGLTDGRFVAVPGYGVAYTTAQGQSSASDWITSDGDDCGTAGRTRYAAPVRVRRDVVTLTRRGVAALALVLAPLTMLSAGTRDEVPACEVVDVSADVSDARVADLIARGWSGRPDDGREALYAPGCAR